jgi:hypothetical protein
MKPGHLWAVSIILSVYDDEWLALHPKMKPKDHPLSVIRDCLFNILAVTLHIRGRATPWWQGPTYRGVNTIAGRQNTDAAKYTFYNNFVLKQNEVITNVTHQSRLRKWSSYVRYTTHLIFFSRKPGHTRHLLSLHSACISCLFIATLSLFDTTKKWLQICKI